MNSRSTALGAELIMLGALLVSPVPSLGANDANGNADGDAQIICLTEQPTVSEGASVMLKAWATTADGRLVSSPVDFDWQVDAGRVETHVASARWDLSDVKVGAQEEARKVTAIVKATQSGRSESRCSVEVFIGKQLAVGPVRGIDEDNLISARHFLLTGEAVAPGYGLYSYLLLGAPPKNDEEKARYLKTIEACLLVLQDVDEYLRLRVRPRSLNATFIPVKNRPNRVSSNADWAASVLDSYDYATAEVLLKSLPQSHENGPYLVSVLQPLSVAPSSVHLWEDLSGVVPTLAWDWIKYFTYLSAQQRSWSTASLRSFGLRLRNLIAVGAKVTPDVLKALEEARAIQFTSKD